MGGMAAHGHSVLYFLRHSRVAASKSLALSVLGRRDEKAAVLGQLHDIDEIGELRHQIDPRARSGMNKDETKSKSR